jgi:hypothetical protein
VFFEVPPPAPYVTETKVGFKDSSLAITLNNCSSPGSSLGGKNSKERLLPFVSIDCPILISVSFLFLCLFYYLTADALATDGYTPTTF